MFVKLIAIALLTVHGHAPIHHGHGHRAPDVRCLYAVTRCVVVAPAHR